MKVVGWADSIVVVVVVVVVVVGVVEECGVLRAFSSILVVKFGLLIISITLF